MWELLVYGMLITIREYGRNWCDLVRGTQKNSRETQQSSHIQGLNKRLKMEIESKSARKEAQCMTLDSQEVVNEIL